MPQDEDPNTQKKENEIKSPPNNAKITPTDQNQKKYIWRIYTRCAIFWFSLVGWLHFFSSFFACLSLLCSFLGPSFLGAPLINFEYANYLEYKWGGQGMRI